jgi:transcriptional regulator of acetoin/glycerol metabolism
VPSPWLALPAGSDPAALSRAVADAHDDFVATGRSRWRIRDVVFESWRRSRDSGVDPDRSLPPVDLLDDALEAYRAAHPLADVMPVIRRLLVEDAVDSDLLVAVSDDAGRLLWVEGAPHLRSRAETMHFMPGAFWSEDLAGTNAPGTALALDHGVQIFAHEHFSRIVQPWSCSAAPIHDPQTGRLLGVLDVTGGDSVAAPQSLALVQAAVAAVENELRVRRLQSKPDRPRKHALPRVRVLAQDRARWEANGVNRLLSHRHSEIVLLLLEDPSGMTSEQLGVRLDEHELADVTIRAEMSRLRSVLGTTSVASRPYRITEPVTTDVSLVEAKLAAGAVTQALDLYVGPVLPHSQAPGVVEVRERLAYRVRAAVLTQGTVDDLVRFGETAQGRQDHEVWAAARSAAARPEVRSMAQARLAWIDQEFGQT